MSVIPPPCVALMAGEPLRALWGFVAVSVTATLVVTSGGVASTPTSASASTAATSITVLVARGATSKAITSATGVPTTGVRAAAARAVPAAVPLAAVVALARHDLLLFFALLLSSNFYAYKFHFVGLGK